MNETRGVVALQQVTWVKLMEPRQPSTVFVITGYVDPSLIHFAYSHCNNLQNTNGRGRNTFHRMRSDLKCPPKFLLVILPSVLVVYVVILRLCINWWACVASNQLFFLLYKLGSYSCAGFDIFFKELLILSFSLGSRFSLPCQIVVMLHAVKPLLRSCYCLYYSGIYPSLMEPECSMPSSQDLSPGACLEPLESDPHTHNIFL